MAKKRFRIRPRRRDNVLEWLVLPWVPARTPAKILSVETTPEAAMHVAMNGRPPRSYRPDQPIPTAGDSRPPYPEH